MRIAPKYIGFLLGTMASLLMLTACSSLTTMMEVMDTSTSDTIIKSPGDAREYRAVTLDNGLQALLISDPTTDKAAAALDVDVGSGADPKGREGLAHFLEHMLFLGTEKYPQPDEYQAFINRNGGNHNAFTAFEHTNYFFDVDSDYLEPALDRFSQQFVAPLFSEEYVEREKNAVHSEYTSKLMDDGRRFFAVVKQAVNQDHPMAKFAVGNLDTLADREGNAVRDDLLKFYKEHYSADHMKLVVYGKENLDALETLIRSKFSAVEKRPVNEESPRPPVFSNEEGPKLVSIKPVKEKRSLSLLFSMPPTEPYYHAKPVYYLTNLIGHEGEGSLLSWLKSQQLAEGLSAGLFTSEDDGSVLSVSISLTEKGRQQYLDIIRDTLTYINKMKQEGIDQWRFEEQAKMLDISFRFQDKAAPIHYVSSLASRLQDFDAHEVLKAPYSMDDFDPNVIKNFSDHLTADNMLAILVAPNVETDSVEPWYEVPYSIKPLSEDTIQYISANNPEADYHMPAENDFIPTNLELQTGPSMERPELLVSYDGYNAWYSKDISFGSPKSSFYLSVRSPMANASARDLVLTELYVSLAKDALSEFSYPAYLAGLDFKLYRHLRGITLRIDGFSEKQPVLVERILATLQNLEIRPERFSQYKRDLQRELRNAAKDKPFERLASEARSKLLQPYWTEEEQLSALDSIDQEQLSAFIPKFWDAFNLVTLTHGNISREQAKQASEVIRNKLLKDANIVEVEKSQVVDLQRADWFEAIPTQHQDTAYLYYLQGPSKSYYDRAAFGLLSQIIGPLYYNEIRTQAQMGYVVFATPYTLLDVPALAFIVQSPSHSADQIHQATSGFIGNFTNILKELPDAEFEKHKEALITRLSESDKTLEQRSDRYWTEIDVKNFQFDTREQIAAQVQAMTKDKLQAYYQQHFVDQRQAMLLTTLPVDNDELTVAPLVSREKLQTIEDRQQWINANGLFPGGD
ncbi:peptidase M16 [Hahella sp. CCB-MM4]|uniref:insulinase family protein n=1 Tax=Hahella sp. (strain CCB-MM4) TaxID=1926491 RepID=UPI000B9B0E28|nr:insulinase family protein [Hahella sp. CCB-MM4]OZG72042.1 peptidase M16 [Hahella sp. CCB-MM4]